MVGEPTMGKAAEVVSSMIVSTDSLLGRNAMVTRNCVSRDNRGPPTPYFCQHQGLQQVENDGQCGSQSMNTHEATNRPRAKRARCSSQQGPRRKCARLPVHSPGAPALALASPPPVPGVVPSSSNQRAGIWCRRQVNISS